MATSTPVVVQTQTTTLSGDLFLGSGPRTVFLHAGVTDRRSWERVVGKLIPQLTAVTFDRRGFGESLVSPNAFSHVEDLLAVIEETGEGPVWLVGSSAGGGVAIDTALSSPEHVVGLVLIAPAVNGSPELELDPATARFEQSLDDAVAKGDAAELNRLEAWLWLDGPKEPEGRVHGPARSLFLEMNEAIIRNEVPEEAGESALDAWS